MMDGLAGYPELDTEDGPGVVVTRDWLLLDEMLVVSDGKNVYFRFFTNKRCKLCYFGKLFILSHLFHQNTKN